MANKDEELKKLIQEFTALKKELTEWKQGIAENVNAKMDQMSQELTDKHTELESSLAEKVGNEINQNTSTDQGDTDYDMDNAIFDL